MSYNIDEIIRNAGQGSREQLVDAAAEVCEICILIKLEEFRFGDRDRGMVAQLFDLQLGIQKLLEEYQDALLTEIRDRLERQLRNCVGQAGTALKTFFNRASRSVDQLSGVGSMPVPLRADIGVLTVIPEELRAVQNAFQIDRNLHLTTQSGTIYWSFKRNIVSYPREISVALGCIGEAGNYDAAAATMRMIGALSRGQCCL
jgi:hypothetical protein